MMQSPKRKNALIRFLIDKSEGIKHEKTFGTQTGSGASCHAKEESYNCNECSTVQYKSRNTDRLNAVIMA